MKWITGSWREWKGNLRQQQIISHLLLRQRQPYCEKGFGSHAGGRFSVGENGGFLQVSGITFTVDTSVESSVVLDENGMFVSCGDARRVKDVRVVLSDGSDVPLDPAKTYTLASQSYLN